MDEASAIKGRANLLFEKKEYDDAIVQYTEVLGVLPARTSNSHDEGEGQDQSTEAPTEDGEDAAVVEKMRILRAVVYANIAACHLAKKEFKEAVVACNESLQDDSLYLKALNRRAQANEEIGTWSSLTSSLEGEYYLIQKKGHRMLMSLFFLLLADYKTMSGMPHPASLEPTLTAALKRLPGKVAAVSEKEKEEMMGKLKGIGDSVLGYFGLSTNNFQMQKGEGGGYSLNFVR